MLKVRAGRWIVAHANYQNFVESLAGVVGVLPTGEKLGGLTVSRGQRGWRNANDQHLSLPSSLFLRRSSHICCW